MIEDPLLVPGVAGRDLDAELRHHPALVRQEDDLVGRHQDVKRKHHVVPLPRHDAAGSQPDAQRVVDQAEVDGTLQALGHARVGVLVAVALAMAGAQAPVLHPHLDLVLLLVAAVRRCVGQRVVAGHLAGDLDQLFVEVVAVEDRPTAGLGGEGRQTLALGDAERLVEGAGDAGRVERRLLGTHQEVGLETAGLERVDGHPVGVGVAGQAAELLAQLVGQQEGRNVEGVHRTEIANEGDQLAARRPLQRVADVDQRLDARHAGQEAGGRGQMTDAGRDPLAALGRVGLDVGYGARHEHAADALAAVAGAGKPAIGGHGLRPPPQVLQVAQRQPLLGVHLAAGRQRVGDSLQRRLELGPARAEGRLGLEALALAQDEHPLRRHVARDQEVGDVPDRPAAAGRAQVEIVEVDHQMGRVGGGPRPTLEQRVGLDGEERRLRVRGGLLPDLGEMGDLDETPVLEDLEIVGGETADLPALAVGHPDLDVDQLDVDLLAEQIVVRRPLLGGGHRRQQRQGEDPEEAAFLTHRMLFSFAARRAADARPLGPARLHHLEFQSIPPLPDRPARGAASRDRRGGGAGLP